VFEAQDLMATHLVTVNEDDTIDHAVTLMIRHRISGLPVLDRAGWPVGIISEFDLLELICEGETGRDAVSHYMSPEFFSVAADDNWVTVADVFREKHVRRLPVLRDGVLVGIVTRHDLMHAIRDARRQIRHALTQQARPTPGSSSKQRNAAGRRSGNKQKGCVLTGEQRK
jgi:CBS domain-containing protein